MSSETEPQENADQTQDAPVHVEEAGAQVLQPKGKVLEDLEVFEWPHTKGEMGLRLTHFNVVGVPETVGDEKEEQGKLALVMISEILRLSQDVHDLKEAVKYLSLQEHLQGKGKGGVRGRGF